MTTLPPFCLWCKHFQDDQKCKAYPKLIPQEIWENQHDHLQPYKGDQDIRFELKADISFGTKQTLEVHREWLNWAPYPPAM
ncbi:MAG: hypothetical protein VSS75_031200 [Candidatus Parabeggiatoa sp.]|nr:hypothetical protein [Candidatus Parabeggiatoa sp.]